MALADKTEPHPLDLALGQRIRERRRLEGISQAQLAEAVGLSFQQVQKYERGTNRVSFSMLILMSRRLGCSASELIDGIDEPARESETARLRADERELLAAFGAISTDAIRRSTLELIRQLAREA